MTNRTAMEFPEMPDPVGPVLHFDERGAMFVVHDPAVADELFETAAEFWEGFDGLARPVRAEGPTGKVYLVVASEQSNEAELRRRVAYYYAVFATRHPTRRPPDEEDLIEFVNAVAEDEVEE